jgi:hypothetical protein
MNATIIHPTISRLFSLAALATPIALSPACDSEPDDGDAQAEQTPAAEQPAEEAELPPLRDGEERFGEGVTRVAQVELQGTQLMFLSLNMPGMEKPSLELLESGTPGTISVGSEPAFARGSLLDLFLAVTEPEVAIPEALLGEPNNSLGERGWFLKNLAENKYTLPRSVCTDSEFESALHAYMPTIDGDEDFIFNMGPGGTGWLGPDDDAYGFGDCSTCPYVWYDYMWLTWPAEPSNVDAAKSGVAICTLGHRPGIKFDGYTYTHVGPQISFAHRTEGNASTQTVYTKDVSQPGWYRLGHMGKPLIDKNFDRKVEILNAVQGDTFDIGHVWLDYWW